MGIQAPAEVKFRLIQEATRRDNNLLKISSLCKIAGVSRSGYYNWCASESKRQSREESDRKDFDLILEAYRFRGYAKGCRGIHMRLLHMNKIMNVKKIRRLMHKYGLKSPNFMGLYNIIKLFIIFFSYAITILIFLLIYLHTITQ